MKKSLLLLSALVIFTVIYGQSKEYHTVMMRFQMYSNGNPGRDNITSRKDTIILNPNFVSITNFEYNSHKTSTFKVTSISDRVYICQMDDFETYKVYIQEGWIVIDGYTGGQMFTKRKYLIVP